MNKIILMLLFAATIALAQKESLSLKESLEIGLQNSREIKIAESEFKYSLATIDEVASQMLPQLSFNASYTRLSDVPPFEVNVPIFPTPIKIQEVILNNYNFKVGFWQPLFTGFKLSSLKSSADLNTKASEFGFSESHNDKVLSISESFWKFYRSQIQVALLTENLASLKNHLHNTELFMENGLATKNDMLKIAVRVSMLEVKLIDAKNFMKLARSSFNKELGYPLEKETTIKTEELTTTTETANIDSLKNEAINNRVELRSLNLHKLAGEEMITAENSGWYPQVFAYGNLYYSNPNQRILPAEDKFNDTWDAGITLQWNLWDWGLTSAKSEKAHQRVKQTEYNYSLLKDAITIDVYNNYLTVNSSIEKIKVTEMAVESSKENYRLTEQKYNQQLATSAELIDAEVDLIESKTNLVNAQIEHELAKLRFKKAVGRRMY